VNKVEKLKHQLDVAMRAKELAESNVRVIKKDLAEAMAEADGIHIGDTVTDADGKLWIVESVNLFSWRNGVTVEYHGVRINKDGNPGKSRGNIFRTPVTKV
jgi:hypothetical protein